MPMRSQSFFRRSTEHNLLSAEIVYVNTTKIGVSMVTTNRGKALNKISACFLILSMLLSFLPTRVFASVSGTIHYDSVGAKVSAELGVNGVLTLSGEGETYDYSPENPAPWSNDRALICRIVIGGKITAIGDYLFYNCENLSGRLVIPESVARVGDCAFSGDSAYSSPKPAAVINMYNKASAEAAGGAEEPEAAVCQKQEIGNSIFFARGGGAYYCSPENTDFAAEMGAAGYRAATRLVPVTYMDKKGHSYAADCLLTENGLLVEEPCAGLSAPSANAGGEYIFCGWAQENNAEWLGPQGELYPAEGEGDNQPELYAPWSCAPESGGTELTAVFKQIPRRLTEQTIKTEVNGCAISIYGKLPEGAELFAEKIPENEAKLLVGAKTAEICFAYDIAILVCGVKYQPADYGESVRVSVAVPDDTGGVRILHVNSKDCANGGQANELAADKSSGAVEFNAESFSPFIGILSETSGVWSGAEDTSWYNAVDTQFVLTTAEQLAGLAALVNGGNKFTGKTITLGNDIALNSDFTVDGNGVAIPNDAVSTIHKWTPIGYTNGVMDERPFAGVFDGANHTIEGIYILNDNISLGLFGYTDTTSSIIRLTLKGSITGPSSNDKLGGIVALNRGRIESCSNYAKVGPLTATDYTNCYAGGIAGNNLGTIVNCANYADICGYCAGGIAGNNDNIIKNCYNAGDVYSKNAAGYIGGIAGNNTQSDTIFNCYSIGSVYGGKKTGGIVGSNYGSLISDYFLKTDSINKNLTACVEESGGTVDSLGSFSNNGGELTASNATSLAYGKQLLAALNGWVAAENDKTLKRWTISEGENGGYPVFSDAYYLTGDWADEGNYDTSWYLDNPSRSEFTIYTAEQLAGLAVLVNGKDNTNAGYYKTETGTTSKTGALLTTPYTMAGKTIILGADIALNSDNVLTRRWTPIGRYTAKFSGCFDGKNHSISNMFIYSVNSYIGLFGVANGTTIQNVSVKNASITGNLNAGMIAGQVENKSLLLNCLSSGEITGIKSGTVEPSRIGGICGYVKSSTIKNCGNLATISAETGTDFGGIGGYILAVAADKTVITNCFNSGDITALRQIGGIFGYTTEGDYVVVTNCYNSASLKGEFVGGVGGLANAENKAYMDINNCYFLSSAGKVIGTSTKNTKAQGPIGFISGAGGELTALTTEAVFNKRLLYGNNLVAALNGWVAAQNDATLKLWQVVEGENKGYPVHSEKQLPLVVGTEIFANGNPVIICESTGGSTVYADNGIVGVYEEGIDTPINGAKGIDLSAYTVYGGGRADDIEGGTVITMVSGAVKEIYGGCKTGSVNGNADISISGGTIYGSVYGGGTNPAAVSGTALVYLSGNPQIGSSSAGISLASVTNKKIIISGALTGGKGDIHLFEPPSTDPNTVVATGSTDSGDAARLALNELGNSMRLSVSGEEIIISYAAISATVPLSMTLAVKADGTVIAPDSSLYAIQNTSFAAVRVAEISWRLVNADKIFSDSRRLSLSINGVPLAEGGTVSELTGDIWKAGASIDGVTPTRLPLNVVLLLGEGNHLILPLPAKAEHFCTITYTLDYVK